MANDKRAALEAARKELQGLADIANEDQTHRDYYAELLGQIDDALKSLESEPLIGMSDADFRAVMDKAEKEGYERGLKEALKSVPEISRLEDTKDEAFQAGYQQRSEEIMSILYSTFPELRLKNQILQMPDQIQAQSLGVAKTAELIEANRLILDKIRNEHLSLVLSATVTVEGKTKPKYSNAEAREAAVESLIADDTSYAAIHDNVMLQRALLKREEIELEHRHNLFRAYLAVAGMGVR